MAGVLDWLGWTVSPDYMEAQEREQGRGMITDWLGAPAEIDHSRRSPHVDDAHIRTPGTGLLGGEMTPKDFLARSITAPGFEGYGMGSFTDVVNQEIRGRQAMDRLRYDLGHIDPLERVQMELAEARKLGVEQDQSRAQAKFDSWQQMDPYMQRKAIADANSAETGMRMGDLEFMNQRRANDSVLAMAEEYGGANKDILLGFNPDQIQDNWNQIAAQYRPYQDALVSTQKHIDDVRSIVTRRGSVERFNSLDDQQLVKALTKLTTPNEAVMASDVDAVGINTTSYIAQAASMFDSLTKSKKLDDEQRRTALRMIEEMSQNYAESQQRVTSRLEQAHGGVWNTSKLVGAPLVPFEYKQTASENVSRTPEEEVSAAKDASDQGPWRQRRQ